MNWMDDDDDDDDDIIDVDENMKMMIKFQIMAT